VVLESAAEKTIPFSIGPHLRYSAGDHHGKFLGKNKIMTAGQRAIFISVTCLGMSSLMTQIVTLREFMNILAGNELVIGLVIANWLLLTGCGSYLGRFAGRLRHPVRWLVLLQAAVALLPFLQISAIRLLKKFIVPGLMLGLHQAFLASFVLLLPYCLVSGFLLPLFSSLGGKEKDAAQIGEIYVLDVIGDIAGGLLFSFLLVYFLSPFQILVFLLVLNLAAAVLVSGSHWSRRAAIACLAALAVTLVPVTLLDFERITGRAQFPGQEVLFQEATPYGNLAVTRSGSQFTVYENGVPVGSSQNVIAAEESVHFGLSQLPAPGNILVVSGGLNGSLAEVLKYPVELVHYVELDPEVIRFVKKLAPGTDDRRVTTFAVDARRHIRSKQDFYDAILIDLADPATAQLNRFYTLEFFREAKRALRSNGVLSFGLSGAENYANPEIRLLASTIFRSLNEVFTNILLVPGSRQYYIAASGPLGYDIDARLAAKNIRTHYVNKEYLLARLSPDRLETARQMVSVPASLNKDFRPASYYVLLHYWLSKFEAGLLLPVLVSATLIILLVALVMQAPAPAASLALSLSGFSGMGLEITLLLAFQVIYGFVYQQLGIIITAFLLGTALGGFWSVRRRVAARALFFRLDLAFSFLAFLLVPVFLFIQAKPSSFIGASAPLLLFPFLTICIGFLVGAQFPLAARLSFHGLEKTAATLYALDFLGAALGALLVAAFAVPLLGIIGTCFLIGTLKLCSSMLFLFSRKEKATDFLPGPPAEFSTWATFLAVLLPFSAIGILAGPDRTSTVLYNISFTPVYHWGLLVLLAFNMLQAMGIVPQLGTADFRQVLARPILQRTKIHLSRWLNFFAFALVVFFPVFRCYFKIPYLFCHVCPRQCVFGYLRPYLVPAALIMNLDKRFWCFHCCPIGTLHDCQARVAFRPAVLPKFIKVLPLAVLAFTAFAYFRLSADQTQPEAAARDWYTFFFMNVYTSFGIVIAVAALLILTTFKLRRPFCELLCPVGTLSGLLLKIEGLPFLSKTRQDSQEK
jgi:spermidine synthase